MKPLEILETALYVDDLNKAEEFYTDILQLKLHSKEENRSLFFFCGSKMLLIFNPDQTKIKTGRVPIHGSKGQGHVAFSIPEEDFDTWREHLKNNNVEIETEVDWEDSGGKSMYFRDPSGNSIELTIPKIWGI